MEATPDKSILLHTCCGPCASACVERLRQDDLEPTLFFSNANIAPREEYERRLAAARQLAEAVGVTLVEDADASHDEWLEKVAKGYEDAPEGGERCRRCFEFSLSRAAAYAAGHGISSFTTSLTVSPHKRSATVFAAGNAAAATRDGKTAFGLYDFKKRDGFRRSVALAKELGLYRQPYCGCEFSRRQAHPAGAGSCPDSQALSRVLPSSFHQHFMRLALEEAQIARDLGEVPAGCVIIQRPADPAADPASCRILARAHNVTESSHDPTAHAEVLAIRQAAAAIGDFRLADTILYVTKEPCAMCAGAIVLARVPVVVWGMDDPQRGGQGAFGILSSEALIHRPEIITGVLGDDCRRIIQDLFKARRKEQAVPFPSATS